MNKERKKRLLLGLVALLLVGYGAYAAFHTFTGLANGCGRDSIASTLFPVRQLHFIPSVERVWNDSFAGAIGDDESGWGGLGQALADSLKGPIMDTLLKADCQTIESLSESLDSLGLSLDSLGSN